jgi:hypothetical protein
MHHVYSRLREWSARGDSNLYDALLNLPKPSQQRLVLAPSLYYLLQSTPEPGVDEIESLKKFIQMEQYLCGQASECPDGSWTALGDCYLPQNARARRTIHYRRRSLAPRLAV